MRCRTQADDLRREADLAVVLVAGAMVQRDADSHKPFSPRRAGSECDRLRDGRQVPNRYAAILFYSLHL